MLKPFENIEFVNNLKLKKTGLFALFMTILSFSALASHPETDENHDHGAEEKKKFNAGEMIMHHVSDAHEIHFFTTSEGTADEHHYSFYLPIILWTDNGLEVFSSSHLYHNKTSEHGHEYFKHGKYVMSHEHIYYANEEGGLTLDESGEVLNAGPMDLSFTKSIAGLFASGIIVLLIFIPVAKGYKRNRGKAPKGIQSLMEPMILFVRDEVAIPSIGAKKADKFMPFLLSTFFFIWVANMLGLIPFLGGFNVMGTLSVTLVLATIVFIITTINGNKHYWAHILWPAGVPLPIKMILIPIEIAGIFIKPAVLMIRLTANITAGHIIILAFVSLIFIFGEASAGAGWGVGVGSLIFMIFMNLIELLVAFLQAYVFTLLAALYFGSAVEEAHH
jgi:F-type H+-transporting ATPase subunit a